MDRTSLGNRISTLRKDRGMTQRELADKLYVSDKAVSKWERGACFPDMELLEKISAVLQITLQDLLGIEKDSSMNGMYKKLSSMLTEQKNQIKNTIIKSSLINAIILFLSFFFFTVMLKQIEIHGFIDVLVIPFISIMCVLLSVVLGNTLRLIDKIKQL